MPARLLGQYGSSGNADAGYAIPRNRDGREPVQRTLLQSKVAPVQSMALL